MLTIGVVGRRTGADWLLPLNFACRMTATSESCRWRISRRATGPPWNLPLAGRFECVTALRARSCPMPEANGCIRKRRTGTTDLQQPVASAYRAAAMQRVGHSRPQRELTVSATFRSSRRQRDRDADDRSQGSAAVARRMCVARWFPERQLNRYRGHWASKTNRMSAAHGAGLTHPTLRRQWRVAPKLPFKHAPTRFATAGQSPASQSFPPRQPPHQVCNHPRKRRCERRQSCLRARTQSELDGRKRVLQRDFREQAAIQLPD